jgi:hypothetical protein
MQRLLRSFAVLLLFATSAPIVAAAGEQSRPDPLDRLREHERSLFRRGSPGRSADASQPSQAENFDLLGHLELPGRSPHADVFFYDHGSDVGKFAYVGTWSPNCSGTGVKVIDVNDPTDPTLVALAGRRPGVSSEDVVVARIGDRDVLAVGVQICRQSGEAGLRLIDVTDPSRPEELSFLPMPAGGVHELDVTVRPDGQALALLAVPFVEFENTYFGADAGGEFRIVDITDPEEPVELSDWGIIADSSLPIPAGNDEISSSFQGLGYFAAIYDHGARAADDGMTAYVSYWDAGVLKFDISNPEQPVLLARTTYPLNADGDAHSLTPYDVGRRRYILQNDEDGEPLSPTIVTALGRKVAGIEEPWAPTLLTDVGTVAGRVHDADDGCEAADYAGASGRVVLADTVDPFYVGIIEGWTVPCDIVDQVLLAGDAGAKALLFNLISPDDAYPYPGFVDQDLSAATGMPIVQIADIDDLAQEIRAALETRRVRVTLDPSTPSLGFLRVFREDVGEDEDGDGVVELRQVGQFSDLPHVQGELEPAEPGSFLIHNTEVNGDRAYSSWYSHGIVALDLTDPREPVLVGQFVPEASANFDEVFGPPFPVVWGVAIDPSTGVVYASDMRSGLWIVEPTGAAAA